jgi:23S rRNA (uracil1939-C5)-methyltransferase
MMQHKVLRMGHKGDGLVDVDDSTVAIAKVLPGETIELGSGRLLRVTQPSADRVEPFCNHYNVCGGCKFQHWRGEPYTQWKHGIVVNALQAAGFDVPVSGLIDAHGAGRRRVSLHVRLTNGTWRSGFMESKTHDLCAIEHCPVLAPALSDAPAIAAGFGPILGPCDVAITAASNGIDVSVRAERKAVEKRLEGLTDVFNTHRLLRLTINNEPYAMRAQPVVRLGQADVPLPLQSFLQATLAGEQELTRLVVESRPRKSRHVADLFSGLGTFSFPLAEHLRVTSIDSGQSAIAALQAGARRAQGLKPILTAVRNLFNAPLTTQELTGFDWVVLDPPRAGAEAQSRNLAKSKVRHVTYVSCDIQSFTRDAKSLVDGGFKLKAVTPVDQFKWTAHVELVGLFER